MERDDRAPVATFFADSPITASAITTLGENAAHHARVKRLSVGEMIRLTDGRGHMATGTIAALRRGAIDVAVDRVRDVERPMPIHLRVPVADRDRMLWLAEKVTELGIATWQAVRFRRSASVSPRGEGQAFAEKVRARMVGAIEQSGGAWLPEIKRDVAIDELTLDPGADGFVLDVDGLPLLAGAKVADAGPPVIIFGPEGGIEPDELSHLTTSGWRRVSLGPTTLRFETAGVAAVSIVRAVQLGGK